MSGSRHNLIFSAGPTALAEIRRDGLRPERIGTLAGASGGAKWLVLSQLDRVVLRRLLPDFRAPVHTIGTSIGAWRFACYGQSDPLAAIERFEEAYLDQSYSEKPDRAEITARSREILDYVLGDHGAAEILGNPLLRSHIMTVRSRHVLGQENRLALAAGLIGVAGFNAASRRTLGAFFERALFHDPRDLPPFYELEGFPMRQIVLTSRNLKDAVLATGSIPLVLEGVRNIEGAPPGTYRDGGVIDYHLDFPHSSEDRLALYLHFYGWIKPGWFDKYLSWRTADATSTERTIIISPSPEFVSRLPHGKIPDRKDFVDFTPAERVTIWKSVVTACEELADELEEVIENERFDERVRPLAETANVA